MCIHKGNVERTLLTSSSNMLSGLWINPGFGLIRLYSVSRLSQCFILKTCISVLNIHKQNMVSPCSHYGMLDIGRHLEPLNKRDKLFKTLNALNIHGMLDETHSQPPFVPSDIITS